MFPTRRDTATLEREIKQVVTDGAILLAVDLSMCAEILSGPEDFDVSRDVNK